MLFTHLLRVTPGELLRCRSQSHQGGLTAIAATVDGNPTSISETLLNRPFFPIDQIVTHFTRPFTVSRVEASLPIASGSSEVNLQDGVATISQPLHFVV